MRAPRLLQALFLISLWPATAFAQSALLVDTESDAVDANPGDGVCATALGECTLRAAIMEANASKGADSIELPAGAYALQLPGSGEDAAATGDLDVLDDLEIHGAGSDVTLVSGAGLDRVFDVVSSGLVITRLTLDHLSVVGGNPAGIAAVAAELHLEDVRVADNVGPGLVAEETQLSILQSEIADNHSAESGGGVAVYKSPFVEILESHVARNFAEDGAAYSCSKCSWRELSSPALNRTRPRVCTRQVSEAESIRPKRRWRSRTRRFVATRRGSVVASEPLRSAVR